MERIQNWIARNQVYFHTLLLCLLSFSIVTSDWMVGAFSFGELILIPLLPIIMLITIRYARKKDVICFFSISLLLASNIGINYYINPNFYLRHGIFALIKAIFYVVVVLSGYRYITQFKLKKRTLVVLNLTALLSIVIGIYIYIAIMTEAMPYEFLWSLTRNDPQSYYFRGTRYLVRMRSVFSEPAHFGFYLNMILGINLFHKEDIKIPFIINIILVSSILITFSFSSIAIMFLLLFIALLTSLLKMKAKPLILSWKIFPIVLIMGLVIYFSWEFLDVTIIQRAQEIYHGEDNAALERLIGSWQYLDRNYLWFGNGLGNTPIIWNNYAYFASDIGVVGLAFSVLASTWIIYNNIGLGILFVLVNFQRGGYLSPSFNLFILFIVLYSVGKKRTVHPSIKVKEK
jgi:hypothetical protein